MILDNMDNPTELKNFDETYDKINQFFRIFEELKKSYDRLTIEVNELKSNPQKEEYLKRIEELEKEILELKKTNKTLKETENLIKNKVERLAVKLENIEEI